MEAGWQAGGRAHERSQVEKSGACESRYSVWDSIRAISNFDGRGAIFGGVHPHQSTVIFWNDQRANGGAGVDHSGRGAGVAFAAATAHKLKPACGRQACATKSGQALDFNAQQWRLSCAIGSSSGILHDFDCVHRLGLHPLNAPHSRVNRLAMARLIADGSVSAVIANMRRAASRVPVQEEARPAVMMHWLG